MPKQSPGYRNAFTIVEMLMVVFVIGVLMSLIVPAVSTVRRESLSVSCQANLRQLHAAIDTYRSTLKGLLPMCDFLPASTPDGPVGGLVEVLQRTVERDCKCWYCVADDDEEGSRAAGTSYIYLPGLLRYTPQVQIQVGALMFAQQTMALTERQRERVRREAESKLVGQLYDRNPGKFAILTDSQDRHKIGDRNPRNAVYIDGSVGILREADEGDEP
ncbi:MAG: hypothetical protein RIT24_2553 [Planctomycetota bacterium]|jgi:prepilin-type N-terminal cleavage/methylation domain-containing protein